MLGASVRMSKTPVKHNTLPRHIVRVFLLTGQNCSTVLRRRRVNLVEIYFIPFVRSVSFCLRPFVLIHDTFVVHLTDGRTGRRPLLGIMAHSALMMDDSDKRGGNDLHHLLNHE